MVLEALVSGPSEPRPLMRVPASHELPTEAHFGAFSVAVPGAVNFPCPAVLHWSAATHGTLLNDN